MQNLKAVNMQREFNRDIINEDAMYKLMAYQGALQKKRMTDPEAKDEFVNNPKLMAAMERFEDYYKEELLKNAKMEPRKYNEAEFLPQRRREKSTLYEPVPVEDMP